MVGRGLRNEQGDVLQLGPYGVSSRHKGIQDAGESVQQGTSLPHASAL